MKVRLIMKEQGFTLIELMISIALVGLVTMAGYSLYLNVFQFQTYVERQKDMQVKLQLAMDILVSDIMAAGYGTINPRGGGDGTSIGNCAKANVLVGIPANNCSAVTRGNNGVGGRDMIILAARDQFIGQLALSTVPKDSGDTDNNGFNIQVSLLPNMAGQVVAGNNITIGGFFTSQIGVGGVKNVGGNTVFTMNTPLNPYHDRYLAGMDVYTVTNIAYTIVEVVGTEPILQRTVNGVGATVASGIEDLQIRYFLSATGQAVDDPGGNPYKAIRVSLVSRTRDGNKDYTGGVRILPLEDHGVGAFPNPNDNQFRRAVLTRVIELRNDGME